MRNRTSNSHLLKLVFNPKVHTETHTVLLRFGASFQITVHCTSEAVYEILVARLKVVKIQAVLSLGDAHYVFPQSISSLSLVISTKHLCFSLDCI